MDLEYILAVRLPNKSSLVLSEDWIMGMMQAKVMIVCFPCKCNKATKVNRCYNVGFMSSTNNFAFWCFD